MHPANVMLEMKVPWKLILTFRYWHFDIDISILTFRYWYFDINISILIVRQNCQYNGEIKMVIKSHLIRSILCFTLFYFMFSLRTSGTTQYAPWPFCKSKFNLKSDRVNLVAPASPIKCLLHLPNVQVIHYMLGL